MDAKNRFHTPLTWRIVRAEHIALLAICTALLLWHAPEVNWWRAFWAFWIIDIVGYLPGTIAFRRSADGRIGRWYHHIYNIAHTWLVAGSGVAVWAYFSGGLEWAMLAVPIHLSVDRGVFGNVLKPVELAFEPSDHSDETVLGALGRAEFAGAAARDADSGIGNDVWSEVLDHPSGYLALSERNQKFVADGIAGFIAYRRQGKHLWMFGGVHSAPQDAGALLDRFLEFASRQRRRVGAVQVRAGQAQLFASRGFTVNQMGTTYATSLAGYSFGGGQKMQLRNKINRARRLGLTVVELGKEVPRSSEWFARLEQISARWLEGKGKKELDFMVGEIGGRSDGDRRIFLVLDAQQNPVAFISYVPVWGKEPGYLHDLTRKIPEAPTGAMELCNAAAIERFQAEGVKYLHFGFTPFIVDPEPARWASGLVHRLIRWLHSYGQKLYPADSQAAYKLKWGTDFVEREYLAVRPVSFRAAFDLLLLTRSL